MKPKLVVIWGEEDILSAYISLYLAAQEDWKVVSITDKEDLESLIRAAESAQTDIVIIHQEYKNGPSFMQQELFQRHPAIKVITFSLENNAMQVYSKHKLTIEQPSDLIAVIENQP